MKKVWQARDGAIFGEKQACAEYEELLGKAEQAISGIKFRELTEGWNLDPEPIKQHDKQEIWDAWTKFCEASKELVEWAAADYEEYQPYPEQPARNIKDSLLEQLDRYSTEHKNLYPLSITSYGWLGFTQIRRKFEAINFENGEEYVGSFGTRGMQGRKEYLESLK